MVSELHSDSDASSDSSKENLRGRASDVAISLQRLRIQREDEVQQLQQLQEENKSALERIGGLEEQIAQKRLYTGWDFMTLLTSGAAQPPALAKEEAGDIDELRRKVRAKFLELKQLQADWADGKEPDTTQGPSKAYEFSARAATPALSSRSSKGGTPVFRKSDQS